MLQNQTSAGSAALRGRILAHRGWWHEASEKNTAVALRRALEAGFGLETDLRDRGGEVVISHDPPLLHRPVPTLADLLDMYRETRSGAWLALNVKADGLADEVMAAVQSHGVQNYFVFDMSVPDLRHYRRLGVNYFVRKSDVETETVFLDRAAGLWLDSFERDHYPAERAASELRDGLRICLVSPELHGRPHQEAWRSWSTSLDLAGDERVLVCTDIPEDWRQFVGET